MGIKGRSFAVSVAAVTTLALLVVPSQASQAASRAPRAKVRVSTPDPTTGRVVVRIKVKHADGLQLRFKAPSSTEKGVIRGVRDRVASSPIGTFTYTPTAEARHAAAYVGNVGQVSARGSAGTDAFTVAVVDDGFHIQLLKLFAPVTVTIAPQNEVPKASVPVVNAPDPSTGIVTGTVSATDPEGDPLTYTGTTTTSKGSVIVSGTGSFAYTPSRVSSTSFLGIAATDTFTVTVSDGYGGTIDVPVSVPWHPTGPAYGLFTP